MSCVEPLARFVENQQAGIFDEGAREENHALKSGGKRKEWFFGEFQQLELFQPLPCGGALAASRRLEQTDRVVKTGFNNFEAGC